MRKLKIDKDLKFLLCVLLFVLAAGVLFFLISLVVTIYGEKLSSKDICISNSCLEYFFKKTESVMKILQATAWLLTLVATVGGIAIAVMTYKSGVKNSNLTNHISHLNMFRDYVNAEIGKRKFISSDKVNIYRWYSTIFPKSKKGDVSVSEMYLEKIEDIKDVIVKANQKISLPGGKYSYKEHQIEFVNKVGLLGIKVSTGPKNDFILIEEQVFELVDCINITFTDIDTELAAIKRLYT